LKGFEKEQADYNNGRVLKNGISERVTTICSESESGEGGRLTRGEI